MKTITELCNERGGTDKGTADPHWHAYSEAYDAAFGHLRDEPITLLEIGIHMADSLWVWRQAFPHAVIAGMDVQPAACMRAMAIPDVVTFCQDQASEDGLRHVMVDLGGSMHVVIDDGCHTARAQQISFGVLFPGVRSGGVYAIEDCPNDRPTVAEFTEFTKTGTLAFAPELADLIDRCEIVPSKARRVNADDPGQSLVMVWAR